MVRFVSLPVISLRRFHGSFAWSLWAISLSVSLTSTLLAAPGRQLADPRADAPGGFASDRVIVKLTPGVVRQMKMAPPQQKGGGVATAADRALSRRTRDALDVWNVQGLAPVFPGPFRYPELAARHELDRYFILEVPPGTDTPAMAAALRNLGEDVEDAEAAAIGEVAGGLFPDDPSFFRQWSMYNPGGNLVGTGDGCAQTITRCAGADISAPEAWDIFTGGGDVTIAIIDSGVSSHSELGDRLLPGINFANKRCVGGSQPGSTCTSSCPGGGVCLPTTDSSDACGNGHGTHVAGIAAAGGNDVVVACPIVGDEDRLCGVAGVNWGAKILPVRVLGGCQGSLFDVVSGIIWAADNAPTRDPDGPNGEPGKVRLVINISLQFYSLSQLNHILIEDAVNYAYNAGAVIVSAAGNFQNSTIAYPAILPNSMAISATGPCDQLPSFSNWGPQLDMAAPGDQIYSTGRFNAYYCNFGTSMAAPHVAGAAALLMSYAPELTNISIRNILTSSADDIGTPGFDQFFGHGRLNLHAAIMTADSWPQIVQSLPPSGSIDARRPHPVDDRFSPEGWQETEVVFRGDVGRLNETDFEVTSPGPGGAASTVVRAIASTEEDDRVRLELEDIIPIGRWTNIKHLPSGTSMRLGYLPGDVNGDAVTNMADLDALIDALEGHGPQRGLWSVDIDRSGKLTPADVIELIDMFNGAGDYDPHFGTRIP